MGDTVGTLGDCFFHFRIQAFGAWHCNRSVEDIIPNMYNALIADIDGTLVPIKGDGSDIDKDTIDAVSGALRRGAQISVATGRGWASTKPVVQKLGIEDLCIVEGGSCIIDPTSEEVVWQITIDAQTSSAVVDVFRRFATHGELVKTSTVPERVLAQGAEAYDFQNELIAYLPPSANR
jgi:hydroxymethylpyrimidine pyrophosphatase-like HAD family hydrolase